VKANEYGSFLIPVLMNKLLSEVRIQIARVSTRDVWKVLQAIKSDVNLVTQSELLRVGPSCSMEMGNITKELHHLLSRIRVLDHVYSVR